MPRCRQLRSFLPHVLTALLLGTSPLIAAESPAATPAQVQQLNAALDGLQDALDKKVRFDLDSVATSFWSVWSVEDGAVWVDLSQAGLGVLEQAISTISAAVSLGQGGTSKAEKFNNWLGAATWGLGTAELAGLGKDLQLSLDGPSYAAGARAMYDRAGAAGKQGGYDAFAQVIREDLPKLTLVRTPEPARARGVAPAVRNVDGFRAAVTAIKADLTARGAGLNAAAVSDATKVLTELRTSLMTSNTGTTGVSMRERPVKLGAIGALTKLHRDYLTQYANAKSAEMIDVTVGAVSAGLDAVMMQLQFSGKAGLSTIDSTMLNQAALNWLLIKAQYKPNVRELMVQVPQYMMFAIGGEESTAWALAENAVAGVRQTVLSSTLPSASPSPEQPVEPQSGNTCEDAMCCPSVRKRLEYRVVAGRMVESNPGRR